MKFLFGMLSVIWLVFGWGCYIALRWEPTMKPPWHIEAKLNEIPADLLEDRIEFARIRLQSEDITEMQRAYVHAALAGEYLLKAYKQQSKKLQTAYLKLSLQHSLSALTLIPDHPNFMYQAADIYHQLKEYGMAELLYAGALKLDPNNALIRRRYHDMVNEMDELEEAKS
ncbi:MAG: hypothetical protein C4527_04615 [Candidatus Omnitrophota bacterium]|jgi:tetratricopeptide (TPR) repeat protein|nr:MAG: hypothetical protein C4527_04615 [Candidatus Omnitrophota bacterium]